MPVSLPAAGAGYTPFMFATYNFLVGFHNLLRWVVVLGGVWALINMVRGLATQAAWTQQAGLSARVFTYGLHLQLLVGLVMYGLLPAIGRASSGPIDARVSLVAHAGFMILAVIAAQVGTSTARRASNDRAKYLRSTVAYAVAMLLIFWMTPWGRSLIPWA
jgi:hypothetical protein